MNWGTKVVLGMIAFMLFIVAMVVYMFRVHGNDALIEEDYYEKSVNFNSEYDAKQNVLVDKVEPKVDITTHQIVISLKDSAKYELLLMKSSNIASDIKLSGNTKGPSNLILIDRKKDDKGFWTLSIKWRNGAKDYLYKENITL